MSLKDLNAKIAATESPKVREEPVDTLKNGPESSRARVTVAPLVRLNLEKGRKAQKILTSLVEAIDADDIDEVLAVWRRAMRAERKFFNPIANEWVVEPDFKVQLEASKIVAAYKEGLPVARQVNLNIGHEELKDVLARAKQSPATMKMMEEWGVGHLMDVQKTGSEKTLALPSQESSQSGVQKTNDS